MANEQNDEDMTTGETIGQMDSFLQGMDGHVIPVPRTVLQRWLDCIVTAAALLDPDNPPSTEADFARMKQKKP
jgi:hypothetical protein